MPTFCWALFFLLSLVVSLHCMTGGVCRERKSNRSAILIDLHRTVMTREALNAAFDVYMRETSGASEVFAENPTILDSNGSLLSALVLLEELLSNKEHLIDVLFLAETAAVSIGVSDALKESEETSSITIISVHASTPKLCGPLANPSTVCMVPWDSANVRGLLEVVSSQLSWHSVAVVMSHNAYGMGVDSVLEKQQRLASSAPTLVVKKYINPIGRNEEDDDIIREILKYRSAGVICFVTEEEFERLHNSVIRLGKEKEIFLLGSGEALNVLEELEGTVHPLTKLWGALFVSQYTSVKKFVAQSYFHTGTLDNNGAHIMSHLFDAMRSLLLVDNILPESIRSVRFEGFSGVVSFNAATGEREEVIYSLISKMYTIDQALITWRRFSTISSSSPVIVNYNSAATASLILSSQLHAVTVCMATSSSCTEVESLNAMIYIFHQQNNQINNDDNNNKNNSNMTTFIPLVINTGKDGVGGLVSLVPLAQTCTFLVGPGRGHLTSALTPVVNQFLISQVDFNTAEAVFSDPLSFPYFSRTIPENMYNYLIYGEVCAYFSWERVLIIGLNDPFGNARLKAMEKSMRQRNIHVENAYMIQDISKESLKNTMEVIYKKNIARIIISILPLYGDDAKMFFNFFDELSYMQNYIFFLGKELCQYSLTHPDERNKAQSSFCVSPYVESKLMKKLQKEYRESNVYKDQMRILSQGGFEEEVNNCDFTTIHNGAAFAIDAAYTVIQSVQRAVAGGVSLNSSVNFLPFIRSSTVSGITGVFHIDKNGNRDVASFTLDVQMSNRTLSLGVWNSTHSPSFRYSAAEPIVWMTGSKETPADTFRDIQFILGTTVSASPGAIVLSVLGFVGTFAVFAFCYRHYKLQRLVELSLEGNCVPVTEEEMRRLRGEHTLRP